MAEVISVITLNQEESASEKKAQIFDNFSYSQSDAVNALNDINTTIKKLATFIDSNKQVVLKIANNYEQFTDYVQTLQALLASYDQATNQVSLIVNNLSEIMKTAVEEFAEQDASLQEDLAALNNDLEQTEALPEGETTPGGAGGAPTSEMPTGEAETPSSTPEDDTVIIGTEEAQQVVLTDQQTPTPASSGTAKAESRWEESAIIAEMGRQKGWSDEQILTAIGISRYETGNYQHLAYGYNYGGVTGSGDLGNKGGYAVYSSREVGIQAFVDNLDKNYYQQNLITPEQIARKYLGYDDTSNWIKGVKGCSC